MPDGFEWDEDKNASNLSKHGLSFEEACEVFKGPVLTRTDDRQDYGEVREVSYGMIESLIVVAVVHTDRNGIRRIISARLAKKSERRLYHAHLERALG
jgi:uncharacterized DUF497 family protein